MSAGSRAIRFAIRSEALCACRTSSAAMKRSKSASTGSSARSAQPAKEVRGEMLAEHELDEVLDDLARCEITINAARRRSTSSSSVIAGSNRTMSRYIRRAWKCLNPSYISSPNRGAPVDVVPQHAEKSREIDRVERLDEGRVAQRNQNVGLSERAVAIDGMPGDVPVDGPRAALGGGREARVEVRANERGRAHDSASAYVASTYRPGSAIHAVGNEKREEPPLQSERDTPARGRLTRRRA